MLKKMKHQVRKQWKLAALVKKNLVSCQKTMETHSTNQESEASGEQTIETHSTHEKDQAWHEETMETHSSVQESEETGKKTI